MSKGHYCVKGFLCPKDAMEEKRNLNDKFMLRLPDGMRDAIKESAKKNNRSMNAEIVVALEMFLGVTGGEPLSDYDKPEDFDLRGLPEEEQLRRIVQTSAQTMYEGLKKAMRAQSANIENAPGLLPIDLSTEPDDYK
jgi:hypothetical protein